MTQLQDFFDHPQISGYSRFFDDGECYYIPTQEFKRILLEDLERGLSVRLLEECR